MSGNGWKADTTLQQTDRSRSQTMLHRTRLWEHPHLCMVAQEYPN
jgi:hypothetical protein